MTSVHPNGLRHVAAIAIDPPANGEVTGDAAILPGAFTAEFRDQIERVVTVPPRS